MSSTGTRSRFHTSVTRSIERSIIKLSVSTFPCARLTISNSIDTKTDFFLAFPLNGVRAENEYFFFWLSGTFKCQIIAFHVVVQSLIMTGFPCKAWNSQEVAVEIIIYRPSVIVFKLF
jgi:hypothetical protein